MKTTRLSREVSKSASDCVVLSYFVFLFTCNDGNTECIKKPEQIGNRSQTFKSADAMRFFVQIDYFGTYDVE